MNGDTNYRFLVAYESIGLDVGESLEGRLPYIRQIIARTRRELRRRRRKTRQLHRLMAAIDVIGGSQEEGARSVAETFGILIDFLEPTDDIYVAWNPHDEPRYARDLFVSGRETPPPDVYALRIGGLVESTGIDLSEMALLGGSRGEVEQ